MRIDKFLSISNVIKSRSLAIDMIDQKIVLINDKQAKKSNKIKINDTIIINYIKQQKTIKILKIPTTNSIKKSETELYVDVKTTEIK